MEIYTSGTSGISAERFFRRLKDANVTALVDTRLHPSSQLAGYAKQDSLSFFIRELLDIPYIHEPLFCPNEDDLKAYRKNNLKWGDYEIRYLNKLNSDRVHDIVDLSLWGENPVILCSEELPDYCHRRLAANYLLMHFPIVLKISHL